MPGGVGSLQSIARTYKWDLEEAMTTSHPALGPFLMICRQGKSWKRQDA